MLEDESGRIRLVGEKIKQAGLVTGIIVAVLGMETPAGDFEVIDYCFPGMAPQQRDTAEFTEEYMDVDYGKYFFTPTTLMSIPILVHRGKWDIELPGRVDCGGIWTRRRFSVALGSADPNAGRVFDG